jgi:peptidoglycan/LPS O-acetylase OafA/YrhL
MKTSDSPRDTRLDWVKGFLVILMAVYHGMNHFDEIPAAYYGYLRFVNGSFVLISGYVVAAFYANGPACRRTTAARQLATRGIKLLLLFTALNLAAGWAGLTNYRHVTFDIGSFLSGLAGIYGSGDTRQAAFRILVPIAYVLILSGPFLMAGRWQSTLIAATMLVSAAYSFVSPVAPNAYFVLLGLVGLSAGLLQHKVPAFRMRHLALIGIVFVALARVMNLLSGNVLAYGLAIALTLKLVYDAAARLPPDSRIERAGILLGRYSLVGYIVQIACLHLLHKALVFPDLPVILRLSINVVVTIAFLLALCTGLDRLRRESRWIEKSYRLVFA